MALVEEHNGLELRYRMWRGGNKVDGVVMMSRGRIYDDGM